MLDQLVVIVVVVVANQVNSVENQSTSQLIGICHMVNARKKLIASILVRTPNAINCLIVLLTPSSASMVIRLNLKQKNSRAPQSFFFFYQQQTVSNNHLIFQYIKQQNFFPKALIYNNDSVLLSLDVICIGFYCIIKICW